MKIELELTEYDIANVNTAMHLVPLPDPLAEIIAKVFYAVERLTPPRPEELKEAIPHIHPHGILDCQFCAPTLTVNWKLTKHDHSDDKKDCPASFCEFNMHPAIRKAFFAPKESDPELALSVSQMKALFDNLVMEGFAEAQAASIVAQIVRVD